MTARTRLRTPDGEPFDSGFVQVNRDGVWVLGRTGVLKVDAASGRVTQYVPLEERPGDPLPLDEWVTDDGLYALRREGRMERYDLRTGKLAQLLPVRLTGAAALRPDRRGFRDGQPAGTDRARGAGARGDRLGPAARHERRLAGGGRPTRCGCSRPGGPATSCTRWTSAPARSARRRGCRSSARSAPIKVGDALWIGSQNGKVMVVETPPAG